jgi:hypothetical protein
MALPPVWPLLELWDPELDTETLRSSPGGSCLYGVLWRAQQMNISTKAPWDRQHTSCNWLSTEQDPSSETDSMSRGQERSYPLHSPKVFCPARKSLPLDPILSRWIHSTSSLPSSLIFVSVSSVYNSNSQVAFPLQVLRLSFFKVISLLSCVLNFLVNSSNYEVPYYAIFSILLLRPLS